MSVECLFSMTLLRGSARQWGWAKGPGPAEAVIDINGSSDGDADDKDGGGVGGLSTSFASFDWGHLAGGLLRKTLDQR